jgi:hypothetical protein
MGTCGASHRTAPAAASTLFQIRRGYRAEWNGLALSVETDCGDWTLRVQDCSKLETLYTARRAKALAAQLVAAEFAAFRTGCGTQVSPDRLVRELRWQEYW